MARAREAGYSLPELLVSTTLLVAVMGGIFGLLEPANGTYRAQPEVTDMQQRLRAVVDMLQRDLVMAGAGAYRGAFGGPMLLYFAPILPRALGTRVAGSPEAPDATAITITYVPTTSAQTTLRTAFAPGASEAEVDAQPGCPLGDLSCGFAPGMRALVYAPSGAYDVFIVNAVRGASLELQHRDGGSSVEYPPGSRIVEVVSHAYYLDTAQHRLYRSDGSQSNPLVDHVVGLRFEYFGDPAPPILRRPLTEPAPWTTYGPRPPRLGVDETGDDWGPGENCVFQVLEGQHVPRLAALGPPDGALVPLTTGVLGDGPWCPGRASGAGSELSSRFDADLLRVRRVRVTVRVQAGQESLRGQNPAGRALFINPGTSRSGHASLPDHEIRFEVTPRNMSVGP
jgi:hypothetical protein